MSLASEKLKNGKKVDSYAGYFATLRFYANGFNSEHLNVNSLIKSQHADWPGFIVADRNVIIRWSIANLSKMIYRLSMTNY